MDPEIQSYTAYFQQAHEDLRSLINTLNPASLHWIPIDNEANSPAILVTHILGAERFRIHQVVGGHDIQRDRDSEFQTTTATVEDLLFSLETINDETKSVLSQVTSVSLNRVKPAARDYENAETGRWHVLHTIEHFGIHLGHLGLTIQMYNSQNH